MWSSSITSTIYKNVIHRIKKEILSPSQKKTKQRKKNKKSNYTKHLFLFVNLDLFAFLSFLFILIYPCPHSFILPFFFFFSKLSLLNCCFLNVNKKGNLKILQNLDFSFETSKFEVQYFFSKEPNRHYAFMLRKLNVRCIWAWDLSYG